MAYMSRLGIWGPGTPFREFMDFIQAVERRFVDHCPLNLTVGTIKFVTPESFELLNCVLIRIRTFYEMGSQSMCTLREICAIIIIF